MKKPNVLDWIAVVITFVGGINWGLVGLFKFNLVGAIFAGDMSVVSRVIYVVVGLCAIYLLVKFLMCCSGCCKGDDKK